MKRQRINIIAEKIRADVWNMPRRGGWGLEILVRRRLETGDLIWMSADLSGPYSTKAAALRAARGIARARWPSKFKKTRRKR